MTKLSFIQRDQIVADVDAYVAAEGLGYYGALQAAVRFGYEAGQATREEETRHLEDRVTVLANRAWNQAVRYMESTGRGGAEYRDFVDELRDEILTGLAALREG